MPTLIDQTTPVSGWRIYEEPDFSGDLIALRGSFFDVDMPLPPLPSGYKSTRLSGAQLESLLGVNRGINFTKSGYKSVRFADTSHPNYDPAYPEPTRAGLDLLLTCLGGLCYQDFGAAGQGPETYRLIYDSNSALQTWRDGNMAPPSPLVPVRWVLADAPEAGIPAYDSLTPVYAAGPPATGYNFATGELVRAYVAGQTTEQFFKRRSPGGLAPAPTNGGDATYWEPVNRADVPNLEQRVHNLEIVLTSDVQDALGGYNLRPSGDNPFLTLADGYIDYRNENVVTTPYVVLANGISNVLTADVRLDLAASQDRGGLLASLRVPITASGPRTVTLGAVGTLDGQVAGTTFTMAPGEVLKIRKPANNNLTSNYQVFERTGAPPAERDIYALNTQAQANRIAGLFTSLGQSFAYDNTYTATNAPFGSRVFNIANGDAYELIPNYNDPDSNGNAKPYWYRPA